MISLKKIIEDSNSKTGRIFDLFIQSLILISLISFSIETLPNLSENTYRLLRIIEIFTVVVFSVEYILRISVADSKLRYIFSFWGIIDLLAILPFYLALAVDLRSVRALRFFRLFRVLKIARYNEAMQRLRNALLLVREELVLFFIVTAFLLYFSSVGIYYFEGDVQPDVFSSVFHSMWWAVATLTTVGYGDVYPVTVGGKVFTFFVLVIGLGLVAIPSGIIATAMSEVHRKN